MGLVSTLVLGMAAFSGQPDGVVLDFNSPGCIYCRQMEPIVNRLEREHLPIRTVDASREPNLAAEYGVNAFPTFVLVVGGQERARHAGKMSEGELRQWLAQIPVRGEEEADRGANSDHGRRERNGERRQNERPRASSEVEEKTTAEAGDEPGFDWNPFKKKKKANEKPVVRGNSAEEPEVRDNATASVPMAASCRVRVIRKDGKDNIGSGTVIHSQAGKSVIATCAHIFRGIDLEKRNSCKIEVDLYPEGRETTYVARIVDFDSEADVGLIAIVTDEKIVSAKVAGPEGLPKAGEKGTSIGCDGGQPPREEGVKVLRLNPYKGPDTLAVSGVPVLGRSGGGLFNEGGELIGICIAADTEVPKPQQCGVYAGLKPLHDLLDKCEMAYTYRGKEEGESELAVVDEKEELSETAVTEKKGKKEEDLSEELAEEATLEVIDEETDGEGKVKLAVAENREREPEVKPRKVEVAGGRPMAREREEGAEPAAEEAEPAKSESGNELAAASEGENVEVVIMVRNKKQPEAAPKIIIVPKASRKLLNYIQGESSESADLAKSGKSVRKEAGKEFASARTASELPKTSMTRKSEGKKGAGSKSGPSR